MLLAISVWTDYVWLIQLDGKTVLTRLADYELI